MPVSSNVFNLAFSSAIVVVSSEEGLVTTLVVKDIAASEAVEFSNRDIIVTLKEF